MALNDRRSLRTRLRVLAARMIEGVLISGLLALGSASASPASKGMNAGDLLFMPSLELRARFVEMKGIGVKWLRVEFDWNRIQPTDENTYVLTQHDRIVSLAQEFNIAVLGLVYFCPPWANGGHQSGAYPPVDPARFARFATHLATRYASVHHWEIWNEPNVGVHWQPAPSPAAYVTLLKLAYAAIKAVDGGATVISGGLAQTGDTATEMRAVTFLDGIYRSGARSFLDAVGNHPYGNWQKMEASDGLRGVMSKYNDQDKNIWVTEYGAPTDGEGSPVVSESAQAGVLETAFQLASQQPRLGPIFWYNYKDWCAKGKTDPDCYYGLLRFDNTRKPSYFKFLQMR